MLVKGRGGGIVRILTFLSSSVREFRGRKQYLSGASEQKLLFVPFCDSIFESSDRRGGLDQNYDQKQDGKQRTSIQSTRL